MLGIPITNLLGIPSWNTCTSERTSPKQGIVGILVHHTKKYWGFLKLKKEKKKRKKPTVVREAIHKSFSTAKNLYGNFAKLALVFPAMQFVSKIDLIWAHTKLHSEASWFPSFWARGKKKRATSRAWKRFGWQIVLFKACYQSLVNQVALVLAERSWESLFDSHETCIFRTTLQIFYASPNGKELCRRVASLPCNGPKQNTDHNGCEMCHMVLKNKTGCEDKRKMFDFVAIEETLPRTFCKD